MVNLERLLEQITLPYKDLVQQTINSTPFTHCYCIAVNCFKEMSMNGEDGVQHLGNAICKP